MLTGEAALVVQSLKSTGSSYHIAWQLLESSYENKKYLVNRHVKALFNLPNVQTESPSAGRQLLDNAQKHLPALDALGQSTQYWDTFIVHMVSERLDSLTPVSYTHLDVYKRQ